MEERNFVRNAKQKSLITEAKQKLTPSENRERDRIMKEESRIWRNFWIRVLKRQGYSNVAIAEDFEISEATVRRLSDDKPT